MDLIDPAESTLDTSNIHIVVRFCCWFLALPQSTLAFLSGFHHADPIILFPSDFSHEIQCVSDWIWSFCSMCFPNLGKWIWCFTNFSHIFLQCCSLFFHWTLWTFDSSHISTCFFPGVPPLFLAKLGPSSAGRPPNLRVPPWWPPRRPPPPVSWSDPEFVESPEC